MPCQRIPMLGGGFAIACGPRTPRKKCSCGKPATLECDWKVTERKSGTCDAPICAECTLSPAPDKDLCPRHAISYRAWAAQRDLFE